MLIASFFGFFADSTIHKARGVSSTIQGDEDVTKYRLRLH